MSESESRSAVDASAISGTAKVIYILYLVALIFPVTSLVGIVMAYVNRSGTDDWLDSHYRFQIRTFWIGLLFSVIAGPLTMLLIGWLLLLGLLVWWIVRCVKGMGYLSRGEAHPDIESWLFG